MGCTVLVGQCGIIRGGAGFGSGNWIYGEGPDCKGFLKENRKENSRADLLRQILYFSSCACSQYFLKTLKTAAAL